ncbi:homoserine kinase [Alphaproteobacteria bacterium]|jgi:homoserine kinase type II|nr:homoserine kinase [Alphaproteobacteria bacterium]
MAVYTEVSPEALDEMMQTYDLPAITSIKGIAEGIQNSNYLLDTQHDRYILTLYERGVSGVSTDELPFYLNLMQHLSGKGVICPTPVARRDGGLLSEVADRPAALVTFLKGLSVRTPKPHHCAELGAAIAKLHLAGQDFPMTRKNELSIDSWQGLFSANADGASTIVPGMEIEISNELERLNRNWPKDLPYGIIHADLFPDNVFFLDQKLSGIIDFYFACNDFFAYDLAICLNAWCFEADVSFNLTKSRALLDGYQSVRPLTAQEVDALPLLCAGAAMRFLLTRLHDWLHRVPGALVTPKNPADYLRRLRFHKNTSVPSDYGIGL